VKDRGPYHDRKRGPTEAELLLRLIDGACEINRKLDELIRVFAGNPREGAAIDAATQELKASSDALETATKNVGNETK